MLRCGIAINLCVFIWLLGSGLAYAQNSSDVVIDYNVLKEMDSYTPPPMFGVPDQPQLEPEDLKLKIEKPKVKAPARPSVKIPPKPKRRPDKFTASPSAIKTIRAQQATPGKQTTSPIKRIEAQKPTKRLPSLDITENDLGQDIVDMKAQDILESIDISESDAPQKTDTQTPNQHPARNWIALNPPDEGKPLHIKLRPEEGEPSSNELKTILGSLVPAMTSDPALAAEIESFASTIASDENPNAARRLSLKRALSVRDALTREGIDEKRIIIKALGDKHPQHAQDALDIYLKKQ